MATQATLVVCEVGRVEADGKLTLIGVYTADLAIVADPTVTPFLTFYLILEGDLSERPDLINCEISLPGEQPFRSPPMALQEPEAPAGRTRWIARWIQTAVNVTLHPGHITGKVTMGGQEIPISGPWITLAQNVAGTPTETDEKAAKSAAD